MKCKQSLGFGAHYRVNRDIYRSIETTNSGNPNEKWNRNSDNVEGYMEATPGIHSSISY